VQEAAKLSLGSRGLRLVGDSKWTQIVLEGHKLADAAAPGEFVRMFGKFRRAALAGALLLASVVAPTSTGSHGSRWFRRARSSPELF
jgi:hypothetical protein